MKKIICLLLVALTVFFTSCWNNNAVVKSPEATKWVESLLEAAEEGELKGNVDVLYDFTCAPFTQSLQNLTDMVKASYITTYHIESNYIHKFEVKETLRGISKESVIYVYSVPVEFDGHSTKKIPYKKDMGYLLLLRKFQTPFTVGDQFEFIDDTLVIPLNESGEPDIQGSRICAYTLASYNFGNESINEAIKNGNFINCIQELVADNSYRKKWPTDILSEVDKPAKKSQ